MRNHKQVTVVAGSTLSYDQALRNLIAATDVNVTVLRGSC